MSYDNQYEPYSPSNHEGMSSGLKVFIVIVCAFGGLVMVCCGVGVYFITQIPEMLSPTVITAPEEIIALTDEIVDIEIPSEVFAPKSGTKFDSRFVGFKMNSVIYEGVNGNVTLTLTEMSTSSDEEFDLGGEAEIEDEFFDNMDAEDLQLEHEAFETRIFNIRGNDVKFLFSKQPDIEEAAPGNPSHKMSYHSVSGSFQGKNGFVTLHVYSNEEDFDEDQIVKLIESIK